jgi:hypothetical protein
VLEVHDDATSDLRAIRTTDPKAFASLFALIQQLKADPDLSKKLLDHGYGSDRGDAFSISKWLGIFQKLPAWRLKFWELERKSLRYRILYVYVWRERKFYVMAIIKREEFDYDDPANPIRLRVARRCAAEFPDL